MTEYKNPLVSIGILDYERPQEAKMLFDSLKLYAEFDHKVVYVSNGGNQDYVKKFFDDGLIDTLILNKKNEGCGIGTRQVFESCITEWVLYVQVDQYLTALISENCMQMFLAMLGHENEFRKNMVPYDKKLFYLDLAGNQGHGNYSERAHLINRKRYLSIPNLDKTIGGPGPYANHQWTENLVQQYMKENKLYFYSLGYFADNGKISRRTYPCGGETMHYTDEKRLFVIKPLKQRYDDFPNLHLNEVEWKLMLEGNWPKEGLIPEADKSSSFIFWK